MEKKLIVTISLISMLPVVSFAQDKAPAVPSPPGGYSMLSALVAEIVLTFMFLIIILGATHSKAPKGFAGLIIGLGLTLIHLISIPVTNTSVNPARSTSQALFAGGWALEQLWLFWVAPIAGAIIAGIVYKIISPDE